MANRWRHDLRYLISALLLILTAVVALTGLVADLWDLNDFLLHTYTGYAMALLALAHTVFELPRLLAYARNRLRPRRVTRTAPARAAAESEGTPAASSHSAMSGALQERGIPRAPAKVRQTVLSRRGILGLLLGGTGGFFLGRATASVADQIPQDDLGLLYHLWSKPGAGSLLGSVTDWGSRPERYKTYPEADQIRLPPPRAAEELTTLATIEERRSVRSYTGDPMALDALSRLLYLTSGITAPRREFRAAPSAGGLYPIETYVIVHQVAALIPGLYHYAVESHGLERLRSGDLRQEAIRAGLMQGFLGEANIVVVLTAIFQRLRWRYRRRTYRYAMLEAGHIGQNIYLAATSAKMGACAVGAFFDNELNHLLNVDGEQEASLYMVAVGRVA